MNQTAQILKHLKSNSITSWTAIHMYGITRLSACIYDLRKMYVIDTTMIPNPNHNGKNSHFAEYTLEK